jgi:hypothetical protein
MIFPSADAIAFVDASARVTASATDIHFSISCAVIDDASAFAIARAADIRLSHCPAAAAAFATANAAAVANAADIRLSLFAALAIASATVTAHATAPACALAAATVGACAAQDDQPQPVDSRRQA